MLTVRTSELEAVFLMYTRPFDTVELTEIGGEYMFSLGPNILKLNKEVIYYYV
jgi:hypothetical protein